MQSGTVRTGNDHGAVLQAAPRCHFVLQAGLPGTEPKPVAFLTTLGDLQADVMLLACPIAEPRSRCPPCAGVANCFAAAVRVPPEHATGRGIDVPLACASATLLLLFPANLMPLLQVSFDGVSRVSRLGDGVGGMWGEGLYLLAIVVGLQGVILPFLRFGMLSAVLAAVRAGRTGLRNGKMFRWAEHLDRWATPDVFLIGAAVGYSRVAAKLPMHVGPGGRAGRRGRTVDAGARRHGPPRHLGSHRGTIRHILRLQPGLHRV